MIKKHPLIKALFLLLLLAIGACKKEQFTTDGSDKLEFSDAKILFDTVFVSIGSVTKNFRVYNNNNQAIRTNIHLAGSSANFRINVNGLPGRNFNDVEIRANDSIWVFVEVTVDPNNSQSLPFILSDSIVFETNGNVQDVKLAAWGQNAHFIVADHFVHGLPPFAIVTNYDWDSILPYVIYGGFAVVDTLNLTIHEGTKIHFGNGAGLWIYQGGGLKVKGSKDHPVVFQGMRRESSFADEPGQWDRIWINDGKDNEIDYAIIKNGFIGLQTEVILSTPSPTKHLTVTNTIIKNMAGFGILSRNFVIDGYNNVIANCGLYCAAFTIGGSYDFTNCTFANYWKLNQRSTPVMYLNNFYTDNSGNNVANNNTALTNTSFKNCIIYGTNDNELELDIKTDTLSDHQFKNCIIRTDSNTPTTDLAHFTSIHNVDPGFNDSGANDYNLTGQGNNFGDSSFVVGGIAFDILHNPRPTTSAPDAGAYEK